MVPNDRKGTLGTAIDKEEKASATIPDGKQPCDSLNAHGMDTKIFPQRYESLQTAKKSIVRNIGSNYAVLFLNTVINLLLTPFLIHLFGIAAYGAIGLNNTCVLYLSMLPASLSGALLRFLSLEKDANSIESHQYYTSCTYALVWFAILGVIPIALFSWLTPFIFQVPNDIINAVRLLFFFTLVGGLVAVAFSPIETILYLQHRFWEKNIITIIAKLVSLITLVAFLWLLPLSISYVGVYQLVFLSLSGILLLFVKNRRRTFLRLRKSCFSISHLYTVFRYASKMLLFDFSYSLVMGGTFFTVNLVGGAAMTGKVAPFIQIAMLFQALAYTVANVLRSIIFEYLGRRDMAQVVARTMESTRLIGYLFGFALVGCAGCAHIFLEFWLGGEFSQHAVVLLELCVAVYLGTVLFVPYRQVFRGTDSQGYPILLALVVGGLHCSGIFIVLSLDRWGFDAIGIVFILTLGGLSVVAQGMHCDKLLGLKYGETFRRVHANFWFPVGISGVLFWIIPSQSYFFSIAFSVVAVLMYCILGYRVQLTDSDRKFLRTLILHK